ncbi:transcriptional regulator [Micromonospora rosaria]|uniref:Transcriptional regulator n=1 Tax=Micromonospora rosaria TaxID=47874 RepID=A0A136PUJ3_9ACTN|nr:winged helix-turn-helix domain-containing protein [Micromonospora rosaria]KXK62014.1 transcriptional regulator [Micromonospora rosaria]
MSVVAISSRPQSPGRRTDRVAAVRPRSTSTLTVTVNLTPGPLSPGLARLVELLHELAAAGEATTGVPAATEPPPVAPALPGPRPAQAGPEPAVEHPDALRIQVGLRTVYQGGREVSLTRIEFDLLLFLAEHPRRVFTRLQLLSNVWGYEHAVARTVDVHVRRLRAKLGGDTPLVTTVHGVGYRIADEARISIDRRM